MNNYTSEYVGLFTLIHRENKRMGMINEAVKKNNGELDDPDPESVDVMKVNE